MKWASGSVNSGRRDYVLNRKKYLSPISHRSISSYKFLATFIFSCTYPFDSFREIKLQCNGNCNYDYKVYHLICIHRHYKACLHIHIIKSLHDKFYFRNLWYNLFKLVLHDLVGCHLCMCKKIERYWTTRQTLHTKSRTTCWIASKLLK